MLFHANVGCFVVQFSSLGKSYHVFQPPDGKLCFFLLSAWIMLVSKNCMTAVIIDANSRYISISVLRSYIVFNQHNVVGTVFQLPDQASLSYLNCALSCSSIITGDKLLRLVSINVSKFIIRSDDVLNLKWKKKKIPYLKLNYSVWVTIEFNIFNLVLQAENITIVSNIVL